VTLSVAIESIAADGTLLKNMSPWRQMNRDQVWKNFDLGQEVGIAGAFLYNGLRCFHDMRTLAINEEVFEFLYDLSVGVERLLKVTVVMLEHDAFTDAAEFEASLITHNHLELLQRVRAHRQFALGPEHHRLLELLSRFYKTFRYDRFSLSIGWEPDKEKASLRHLLEVNLGVSLPDSSSLFPAINSPRYRKHIGAIVGKISSSLFAIISAKASSLNLYTYELRHGSKAEKIFLQKQFTFDNEDVLWKELLVYFMNTKDSSGLLSFLRDIEPLPFDKALCGEYLACFQSEGQKSFVMDELDHLFTEVSNPGERLALLSPLGDPSIDFGSEDEDDDVLDWESD
jgi:hypothetical protein